MCQLIVEVYACARTEVIVSAVATMSASPALTICSSRSFSMGSIPLGTLSISENIRCSSAPGRRRKRRKSCCTLDKNHTGWIQNFCTCRVYRCVTEGQGGRGLSTSTKTTLELGQTFCRLEPHFHWAVRFSSVQVRYTLEWLFLLFYYQKLWTVPMERPHSMFHCARYLSRVTGTDSTLVPIHWIWY